MRGGTLPPALLCAALAFALAFAPRRMVVPALLLLVLTAAIGAVLPIAPIEIVFIGCWASVILTAAMVHLPVRTWDRRGVTLILAANAGIWAAATVAVAGVPLDLARALPFALLVLPARWLVAHRGALAVKVVASWLVAVAILNATLPIVPTPGYAQDHME